MRMTFVPQAAPSLWERPVWSKRVSAVALGPKAIWTQPCWNAFYTGFLAQPSIFNAMLLRLLYDG
jgi:hypothetical protein